LSLVVGPSLKGDRDQSQCQGGFIMSPVV
jgi:hypothetical protein